MIINELSFSFKENKLKKSIRYFKLSTGVASWYRKHNWYDVSLTGKRNFDFDSSNLKITRNSIIVEAYESHQKSNNIVSLEDIFWPSMDQSIKW